MLKFHLKFVDCTVRFRELPNITILNQTEVKLNELLVVLLGNPLIDAVKSKNIVKNPQMRALKKTKTSESNTSVGLFFLTSVHRRA